MTREEKLEKARRDYPPRSKVTFAHLNGDDTFIIPKGSTLDYSGDSIHVKINGQCVNCEKTHYSMVVYYNKEDKWSKILESPKPQFEVGKWYKSNYITSYWYYIKVYKVNDKSVEGSKCSQYYDFAEGCWNIDGTLKQALEIGPLSDLSEIQQYLPDGHPDKIKTNSMELPNKWKVEVYADDIKDYLKEKYGNVHNWFIITKSKMWLLSEECSTLGEPRYATQSTNFSVVYGYTTITKEEFLSRFKNKSKELTELPDKWCISRNLSKENNEIVTRWINKMCGGAYISQNFADDWYLSNYQHGNKRDYTDYTEITFDQFKKWVLKEEKTMDKIEVFPGIFVTSLNVAYQ